MYPIKYSCFFHDFLYVQIDNTFWVEIIKDRDLGFICEFLLDSFDGSNRIFRVILMDPIGFFGFF